MATLINTSVRVLGFQGGKRRGGFTLHPGNERFKTTDAQDARLHEDRAFKHYLSTGEVVDVENTFGDAPVAPAVKLERPARAVDKQSSAQTAPKSRKNEIMVPPPVVPPAAPVEPAFVEEAPPAPRTSVVDLSVEDACAAVKVEGDLEVLKAWFAADARTDVRAAINARGAKIINGG